MNLKKLIVDLPVSNVKGELDKEISKVVQDSRKAVPGSLFIALKGFKIDGHQYVNDAISRGAVAVMINKDSELNDLTLNLEALNKERPSNMVKPITFILVDDTQKLLFSIGKTFYQDPASHLKLIGVVGTNGKTTSTFLIKSILEEAGKKTGLVGTISNIWGDKTTSTQNTTPGPLELQELFAQMVAEDVEYVVMEVSSHAIALGRVEGLTFTSGVFTNITQDHLDFHRTFEEYFRVKSSFFRDLSPKSSAVINIDDKHGKKITDLTKAHLLTYGLLKQADIRAENIKQDMTNTNFTIVSPYGQTDIRLNLIGDFNVYNALGSIGIGLSLGLDLETIKKGIEKVKNVPGRFESITGGQEFTVVIDYAHTPDGLENLLRTARGLATNRLITVFGCGGDRDRGKRPIMGDIAAHFSDFTIITNDNPRSEDPLTIAEEIEKGFLETGERKKYKQVLDRREAIEEAIFMAKPGDIVVIAGKGHENYQVFADRTIHFDDGEVASAALKERFNLNA